MSKQAFQERQKASSLVDAKEREELEEKKWARRV